MTRQAEIPPEKHGNQTSLAFSGKMRCRCDLRNLKVTHGVSSRKSEADGHSSGAHTVQPEEQMFDNPSLITRIAVGKAIGLIFGLAGFLFLRLYLPGTPETLQWGILLWYTTVGALIGVFGVFARHPILKLPMPWWFRAPVIGAWMNFVLILFIYDTIGTMLVMLFPEGTFTSPFWFVAEGALVGLVIGFFATRFGGEGKSTVGSMAT